VTVAPDETVQPPDDARPRAVRHARQDFIDRVFHVAEQFSGERVLTDGSGLEFAHVVNVDDTDHPFFSHVLPQPLADEREDDRLDRAVAPPWRLHLSDGLGTLGQVRQQEFQRIRFEGYLQSRGRPLDRFLRGRLAERFEVVVFPAMFLEALQDAIRVVDEFLAA
jgi:hypothetical protein